MWLGSVHNAHSFFIKSNLSRIFDAKAGFILRTPQYADRTAQTNLRRYTRNGVYTPAQVAAHVYAVIRNSCLRTISGRWIYFIFRVKACVYAEVAGFQPMTIHHPRLRVGELQEFLYLASAQSLRRRSALVTENTRPKCAKWSAYTAQICVRSINPA